MIQDKKSWTDIANEVCRNLGKPAKQQAVESLIREMGRLLDKATSELKKLRSEAGQ